MLKLKNLEPEQIQKMAYLEGSLDTIYNELGKIYESVANDHPAIANYLVDAMGAIDSAAMAVLKMFDKKSKD